MSPACRATPILTGDTFKANFTGGRIGPLTVSGGSA